MDRKMFYIALALLDLFMVVTLLRTSKALRVDVLDVGQGDAILITTPEQNHILVDGGPDFRVLTELGALLPPGVRTIDLLVLTHPHADHLVGLIPVLERFKVGAVLFSAPAYDTEEYSYFVDLLLRLDVPIYIAEADTDFRFGSTFLDVLYPLESLVGDDVPNVNNASVVLKVNDEWDSILLMGDAEQEVETELLEVYGGTDVLEADVLKAGHHGSKTSSTFAFLEVVGAEWMLISCGEGNSYGHPSEQTLNSAQSLGIDVFRTDTEGRISVEFTEETVEDLGVWNGFYSWLRSIFAPSLRSFSSNFS